MDAVPLLREMAFFAQDLVHKVFVAVDTVVLQDLRVMRADADRLVEVLEGEALRVPDAVLGLRQILGDKLVRRVAVVTGGMRMMTGLRPAIVMIAHDLAVMTRLRIVAQVREALAVGKSEGPSTSANPDQGAEQYAGGGNAKRGKAKEVSSTSHITA